MLLQGAQHGEDHIVIIKGAAIRQLRAVRFIQVDAGAELLQRQGVFELKVTVGVLFTPVVTPSGDGLGGIVGQRGLHGMRQAERQHLDIGGGVAR